MAALDLNNPANTLLWMGQHINDTLQPSYKSPLEPPKKTAPIQLTVPAQSAVPVQPQTAPQIDWSGFYKLLSDPRATPAFINFAVSTLTNLLRMRQAQQVALARLTQPAYSPLDVLKVIGSLSQGVGSTALLTPQLKEMLQLATVKALSPFIMSGSGALPINTTQQTNPLFEQTLSKYIGGNSGR